MGGLQDKALKHKGQTDDQERKRNFPYLNESQGFEMYRKASIVKFADRLSNLSRMNDWDESKQMIYLNRSQFWKSVLGVEEE